MIFEKIGMRPASRAVVRNTSHGSGEAIVLEPGDWINIPAHQKHRVEWTDPKEKTIWLAVHY